MKTTAYHLEGREVVFYGKYCGQGDCPEFESCGDCDLIHDSLEINETDGSILRKCKTAAEVVSAIRVAQRVEKFNRSRGKK